MAFKIYTRKSQFYIEDTVSGRRWHGHTKDVRVNRGVTVATDFFFEGLGNWNNSLEPVALANIQTESGGAYTSAEFIAFYEKNTGTAAADGSFDVNIQDQTSDIVGVFAGQTLDTASLIANEAIDDETIAIETTGTTPVAGNFLTLQENGKTTQTEILVVTPIAGNQYTLDIDMPLDYAYTTAAGLKLQNVDMDVNGSVTAVDFLAGPIGEAKWDITRIMVGMVLGTAGDDGLFGNLTALTNGMYVRKDNSESTQNIFNMKDNSDFGIEGFDLAYPVRSGGGGSFGMRSRITFGGQSKRGVVIRLGGPTTDTLRMTVRDNLTGINKFRIRVQGHVVVD